MMFELWDGYFCGSFFKKDGDDFVKVAPGVFEDENRDKDG